MPKSEVKQMPMKPKRPCSYPNCPELTDGRFVRSMRRRKHHGMKSMTVTLKQESVMVEHGSAFEIVIL